MVLDDDTAALVLAALPDSAKRIAGMIGLATTLRLLWVCGGQRWFLAKYKPQPKKIVESVGEQVAQALRELFGPGHLELPGVASVERALRNRAIRAGYLAGATLDELSDKYRITNRHLRFLLRDLRPARQHRRQPAALPTAGHELQKAWSDRGNT